jgi:hypothetical protein
MTLKAARVETIPNLAVVFVTVSIMVGTSWAAFAEEPQTPPPAPSATETPPVAPAPTQPDDQLKKGCPVPPCVIVKPSSDQIICECPRDQPPLN